MTMDVISIGMIGSPKDDHDSIVGALDSQSRLRIGAVYSPVYEHAEKFARAHQAVPMGSLRPFAEESSIHGVIWNSFPTLVKWSVTHSLRPILLRKQCWSQSSPNEMLAFSNCTTSAHALVIPELLHRWTPATLRMRELIATRLGPIHTLEIRAEVPFSNSNPVWNHPNGLVALDMIRMLVSLGEVSLFSRTNEKIDFRFERQDNEPCECFLEFVERPEPPEAREQAVPELHAQCDYGDVEVTSDHRVRWIAGTEWTEEILVEERPAAHVLLDLFGRRIAGGIVPVPDLNEIFRCYRLAQAIQESFDSSQEVMVNDALLPIDNGEFSF